MRGTPRLLPFYFVLAALVAACTGQKADGNGDAGGAPPAPEVGFVTVESAPFTLENELPGRTAAYQVAEVRPQVTGIIEARLFEEGERVTAGQPLYQIDDALYATALENAKAELELARATLEIAGLKADRYEKLSRTDALSRQNYDEAVAARKEGLARVAAAEAAVRTAGINLGYTTIRAPIDGRIGRSMVTPGALVTANQETALATIRQLDPIYVDVTQSFDALKALRDQLDAGMMDAVATDEAEVTLVYENGDPYQRPGTLKFSEYAVNESTGSVTLRAMFPNPDLELLPGMFVRARLPQGAREAAILVPQKSVSRDPAGRATAYVIGPNDTIEAREVRTERAVGNRWLVSEGLAAGDRLVVDSFQRIRPGVAVRPVDVGSGANGGPQVAQGADGH